MDYKEQIEQAKHAAEKWREKHRIVGVGELRVDCMVDDLTRSITDLLARAEAAEARCASLDAVVSEYQEEIIPGFRKLVDKAETRIKKLTDALEREQRRAEKAENVASDLCEDFTDFVTGGIHNAAPFFCIL